MSGSYEVIIYLDFIEEKKVVLSHDSLKINVQEEKQEKENVMKEEPSSSGEEDFKQSTKRLKIQSSTTKTVRYTI